jgi:hypothetical protein
MSKNAKVQGRFVPAPGVLLGCDVATDKPGWRRSVSVAG